MNNWFQISLGFCPAVVIFLCLIFLGKKKKPAGKIVNAIVASVFGVAAISMCVLGLSLPGGRTGQRSNTDQSLNVEFAYAIASVGDYELADEIVNSMRTTGVESAELIECDALLYAAKGDAITAKALLVKADMLNPAGEYDELIALCDEVIAEDMVVLGFDTSAKRGALMEFAHNEIDKKIEDSKTTSVAETIVEAEDLYKTLLTDNVLDAEKAEELAEEIEIAFKKSSGLKQIKEVRLCRLKLLVLAGKYDKIAEELDDEASFDEVAIVSELYINDLVDNKDFSSEYGKEYVTASRAVAEQLSKIRKKVLDEATVQRADLNRLIDRLKIASKDAAIGRLKEELHTHADNIYSVDRPKAYMQLARIEYAEKNDEEAAQYISAALNTVGVSNDEEFYMPMFEIVDSITDKDDVEKVKKIAQYAEEVTQNSSDYVVVKSIERAVENGAGREEEDNDPETEKRGPFEQFFADEASQKRNAFSITSVDATAFETVKLVVNVDPSISITEEELKELISLKDCNVDIEDFKVEKVTYSQVNILLCCDTSGSMRGTPISDLRNAVVQFVESASDVENLALVTFANGVGKVHNFGSNHQDIISTAESLYANGGTNMYGAIIESIKKFSVSDDTLNFILLMSDGEDNDYHSTEEIENNIGAACKEKGIVLFSMGLGSSVNAEYMNTLATSTGGYFIYVNDSATLNEFYTKIRSQILNRYIITYEAKDTLRASRSVTISLKDSINSNVVSDTKWYTINGTDADVSQGENGQSVVELEGLSISGLDTRRVFKNSKPVVVNLLGTNFTDKMSFDVKLDGKLNYENLAYKFVDSKTISITLPGGMACGTYDLVINVDGKTAILKDELTISAMGTEKTTTFGNYVFTSDSRVDGENGILLSGYVTMNGWLHFNGDVRISGDLDGYSICVTDNAGSYIKYYKDSATGLAKTLAANNIAIPFAQLGSFNIYNDSYSQGDSPEHRVDTVPLPLAYIYVLECRAPGLEVYPDKIVIKSEGFTTKFPMQDTLLKAASLDDLYSFDMSLDIIFTNKTIDANLEIDNKNTEEDTYYNRVPANFGMMAIYTTPADYEIKINTNTNEYLIDFSVKVAFIDSEGIGLRMEWGARDEDAGLEFLIPKAVQFKSDFAIKSTLGTVPVTYRDFKIGIEDIDPNSSIWEWKLVGGFDLETTKLSEFVPGLKDYIGDPAILKLDDIKATISLGQRYIGVEATGKLLEEITLGKLSIDAGKFPYTCELLGMYDQDTVGLKASLTAGVIWDSNNVDINLSGTGILNLHTRFFGVEIQGICDIEVSWWIFEKGFYEEGRALLGFMNDGNNTSFVIKCRDTSKRGTKELYLFITDGELDCGIKKL